MKFRQLDLNLLRVLVALHRTGSVTAAGRLLALSQPATSHLLAKLRDSLGDVLFIRTPKGLKPTPLCDRIAPAIQAQLAELEATLTGDQAFDPARARVDWRVSLSDLGEMMFLPGLATVLRQEAPLARISNIAVPAPDVPAALDAREIDFAIGILLKPKGQRVRSEVLFEERYVAVSARGWTPRGAGKPGRLGLAQLRHAGLVVVSPEATARDDVEKILVAHQLTDRIMLRARHFGAMARLTMDTDLLAIVPAMYAQDLSLRHGLRIWELPMRSIQYPVNLLWHASTDHDAAHVWMRERVRNLYAYRRGGED